MTSVYWVLVAVAVVPSEREGTMLDFLSKVIDFLSNTWVMVGMGVVLVVLIVVFFYVRKSGSDD